MRPLPRARLPRGRLSHKRNNEQGPAVIIQKLGLKIKEVAFDAGYLGDRTKASLPRRFLTPSHFGFLGGSELAVAFDFTETGGRSAIFAGWLLPASSPRKNEWGARAGGPPPDRSAFCED
jgi:hypothetical protein